MKVIIAGPRDVTDYALVIKLMTQAVIEGVFPITEVISGKAKGVDTLGEQWAKDHEKSIKDFSADWAKHGRAAGPIRNREMGDYAKAHDGALCALYHAKSKGSKDMIGYAEKIGLKVVKMEVPVPNA